jgi:hypothetical protein
MVVAGNRVNLGFAPESAKGPGKNDAIMVLMERAAAKFVTTMSGLAESFASKQRVPVQRPSPYCH